MLASNVASLRESYDLVIVGSGYGGAIPAARLGFANHASGSRLSIALLERGDEYPTGSFPERAEEFFLAVRHPTQNPLGLYEYLVHDTVDVLQGCGLGGTSLINANVAIIPDEEVFQTWPEEIRNLAANGGLEEGGELRGYYDRASQMLGALRYAENEDLAKVKAFRICAERTSLKPGLLNLVVSKEDRVTRYGVTRKRCINCGDCVTGCNVGAKNTLATNYLPLARACGVELFPRVEVDHVRKNKGGEGWELVCRQRFGSRGLVQRERVIAARRVILAGGTLGTAGILLRSREHELKCSESLGHHFSGNGDFLSFCYNSDYITDVLGFGEDAGPRSRVKAGPTITTFMRVGEGAPNLTHRFTVEDVSFPRALVDALRGTMFLLSPFFNLRSVSNFRKLRSWARDICWSPEGAANRTLGFLIMGHDDSNGRIVLKDGGSVTIQWEREPYERIYKEINGILNETAKKIGGAYIPNPSWHYRKLGSKLGTAHPLGGCATADDISAGVVNHVGQVFNPNGGVYDGLYISDGSVVPRALGVNPFLTISMFAERMAEHLRAELNLPPFDPRQESDDRLPPSG